MIPETTFANATTKFADRLMKKVDKAVTQQRDAIDLLNEWINKMDDFLKNAKHCNEQKRVITSNPSQPSAKPVKTQPLPPPVNEKDALEQQQLLERCSHVYVFLETLAHEEAHAFTDTNKGRLRKAQAHMTRIRLWLLDNTADKNVAAHQKKLID